MRRGDPWIKKKEEWALHNGKVALGTLSHGHSVTMGTQSLRALGRRALGHRALGRRALSRSGTQSQGTQSLHPQPQPNILRPAKYEVYCAVNCGFIIIKI